MLTAALLMSAFWLQDTTPPSRIDDLDAKEEAVTYMKLTFTAPFDDAGTQSTDLVQGYKVYVSDVDEITAATIGSAGQVTEDLIPQPAIPGVLQEMVVHSHLDPNTRYYFAIVAFDEAGNQGLVSNSPTAKTSKQCPSSAAGGSSWLFALLAVTGAAILSRSS